MKSCIFVTNLLKTELVCSIQGLSPYRAVNTTLRLYKIYLLMLYKV